MLKMTNKTIFFGIALTGFGSWAFADCTTHVLDATVKWNMGSPLSKSARIVAETGPDYSTADKKNVHPSCIESAPLPAGNAPMRISAWSLSDKPGSNANPLHVTAGKVIRVYVKSDRKKYPAQIVSGDSYPVGSAAKNESALSVTVP